MASALVGLANVTLGANASSVTFSSISGSYKDLFIMMNITTPGFDYVQLRFNGLTTLYGNSHYDGTGSSTVNTYSSVNTGQLILSNNGYTAVASTYNAVSAYVLDYSTTGHHKTIFMKGGSYSEAASVLGGRIPTTSALTSVVINLNAGSNLGTGTTISLFGVTS